MTLQVMEDYSFQYNSQRTKAHTFANRTSQCTNQSLQKSVLFSHPRRNSNYFSPTLWCFNFFVTTQPPTDNQYDSLLQTLSGQFNVTRSTEARTANSVLPQLAVTCKIETEYYYQTFVQADSEVLRNRQLRQHANR
jgi:hypothetical protein